MVFSIFHIQPIFYIQQICIIETIFYMSYKAYILYTTDLLLKNVFEKKGINISLHKTELHV